MTSPTLAEQIAWIEQDINFWKDEPRPSYADKQLRHATAILTSLRRYQYIRRKPKDDTEIKIEWLWGEELDEYLDAAIAKDRHD